MIVLLLVLKLLVSSHPLNFKGVLAFMFCYIKKDKLNTTLLCFLYARKNINSLSHNVGLLLKIIDTCPRLLSNFH